MDFKVKGQGGRRIKGIPSYLPICPVNIKFITIYFASGIDLNNGIPCQGCGHLFSLLNPSIQFSCKEHPSCLGEAVLFPLKSFTPTRPWVLWTLHVEGFCADIEVR